MRKKKWMGVLTAAAVAAATVLTVPGTANAAGGKEKLPRTLETTKKAWSWQVNPHPEYYTNNPSQVVELGNYLYIVGGGKLYKLNKDGSVAGVSKETVGNGMNVWLATNGSDTLYVQNVTFVSYDEKTNISTYDYAPITAYNTSDLTVKWTGEEDIRNTSYGNSPLTYSDGYVYGDNNGEFFAIDANTGKTLWKDTTNASSANSAPVVVGNKVIFGGFDGNLYTYGKGASETDGQEDAVLNVGSPVYSSFTYSNGALYYITTPAYPNAPKLHRTTISADGTLGTDSSVNLEDASASTTTPKVSNGKVYVGGTASDGTSGVIDVYSTDLKLLGSQKQANTGKLYDIQTETDPSDSSNTLLYTAYYGTSNADYSIKDTGSVLSASEKDGQISDIATYGSLAADNEKNFSDAQITIGTDGTIYYSNDSGYLSAFQRSAALAKSGDGLISKDVSVSAENGITLSDQLEVRPQTNGTDYQAAEKAVQSDTKAAEKVDGYKVYNITLLSADNVVKEPTGDVTVTIPAPADLTLGNGQHYQVYRLNDDGTLISCNTTYSDGKIQFMTNHFSTYIIARENDAAQADNGSATQNNAKAGTPASKTTGSSQTTTQGKAGAGATSPKTGEASVLPEFILIAAAGAGIAVLSHRRRKSA